MISFAILAQRKTNFKYLSNVSNVFEMQVLLHDLMHLLHGAIFCLSYSIVLLLRNAFLQRSAATGIAI